MADRYRIRSTLTVVQAVQWNGTITAARAVNDMTDRASIMIDSDLTCWLPVSHERRWAQVPVGDWIVVVDDGCWATPGDRFGLAYERVPDA